MQTRPISELAESLSYGEVQNANLVPEPACGRRFDSGAGGRCA
jgi:hypothetical protein